MSVVTYFVETSQGYLDTAAETQFGSVAATVGTLLVLGTTVVVIFVFLNMIYQYKAMDGRTAFWLAVKIGLIGIFATNWVQFNALSSAILAGIDSIAGALVASVGGGVPGPSGTFAEEFDRLIAELGEYLNAAGSELNWMAGAMLDIVGVLMLSILGGLAAFILVASRLMIALLIGIAPIMIFLTLFDVTKDYFARWLSALISFAIYPIVVAGVFATITGVADPWATQAAQALRKAGLRVETDLRNEKIGYKVREHALTKIPIQIAVGAREAEEQTVSIRRHGQSDSQVLPLNEAIATLTSEAHSPLPT